MWMAWDRFRRTQRGDNINVDFYTGMPTMFSVKKYSEALNSLRQQRHVGGYFEHNLVKVNSANHTATFKKPDGTLVDTDYTVRSSFHTSRVLLTRLHQLLHVTPPMGPLDFIKKSPIADSTGWVSVDPGTLRHTKSEFGNIFAIGDCSSTPTSKTAAAITAQAPILTENLFSVMDTGKLNESARYDGYTSCPVSSTSSMTCNLALM